MPDEQPPTNHGSSTPNQQTANTPFNPADLNEEQLALLSAHPTLAALFSEMVTGSSPYLRLNEPASTAPSGDATSSAGQSSNRNAESQSSQNATSSVRSERAWSRRTASSRPSGRSSLPSGGEPSRSEIRPGSSITIQAALFTNGRPNPSRSMTQGVNTDGAGASSSPARPSFDAPNQRRTRSASFPAGQAVSPRSSTSGANSDGFFPRFGQHFGQRGRRTDRPDYPLSPADGPTAVDIADTVNRLLRVATAATAATIVARSEGLPPPPGAGAPPENPMAGFGLNRQGNSAPLNARFGPQSHQHGSASGPQNRSGATAASNQSAPASDLALPSSRASDSGPIRNGRLRNLVHRGPARSMQRSRNSLDLLADSRNSQSSLGTTSSSESASTSTRSLSSATSSRSHGWLNPWRSQSRASDSAADAAQSTNASTLSDALEGARSTSTSSDSARAASSPSILSRLGLPFHSRRTGSNTSQPTEVRSGDGQRGADTADEDLDSLFDDSVPAYAHRTARSHMEENRHAAETMSDLLRQSLAQPMPSQLQRSRSQASLRGSSLTSAVESSSARSAGTGPRHDGATGNPGPESASHAETGERDDGSGSVRFDIRDSAASIATMLDRARAGLPGESEAVEGSFEWFLNQVCRDLVVALEQMDAEQERAIIEQTLHSGSHLPTMSGQPGVSTSFAPNTNATSDRRQGDVRRAELSFFRVFCFPRANQDGVSASASPAPAPSGSVPPAGATSLASDDNFVLHPDLIPCVVVGVRSATWTEMRDGQAGATDESESGPRLRSAGPGPWPPWIRSFQSSGPSASEDTEMTDASSSNDATPAMTSMAGGDAETTRSGPDSDVPPRAWRFVVYITGGFWPRSHPLLQAPSVGAAHDVMHLIDVLTDMAHPELVGGSNAPPGFEPMFGTETSPLTPGNALFEMLSMLVGGQTRPQKATKAELAKSQETKVAKGWELLGSRAGAGEEASVSERVAGKQRDQSEGSSGLVAESTSLVGQGLVLESTAQRCLICLDDWQLTTTLPTGRKAGVTKAPAAEGQAPAYPQAV
ncbi:hypothetical protein OC861_001550 [Tilletia horrida]|nr:hypothetical protein OC861_001550 [Tilletia horrida]